MKTSYFGRVNSKAFRNRDLRLVSIARSAKYFHGERYPALFPTWNMIHITDEEEYEKAYHEQILSKLDPMKVWEDLHDAVILCHESMDKIEKGETFCHRHIVARWLEEELWLRGIDVEIPELRDDKKDLKKILLNHKQMSLFD